ncbi:hypothetical protein Leryth_017440 [Lithospermum erythrorhizon]|nr:hypothetical protein Leryth_017440 [Lithospermum erythrorhizon]
MLSRQKELPECGMSGAYENLDKLVYESIQMRPIQGQAILKMFQLSPMSTLKTYQDHLLQRSS